MDHPLSYAMRNEAAVNSLIYFNAPSQLLDWSFLAIEWVVYICCALGLLHAVRQRSRSGSPAALYTFAAVFLYGLTIDIISYYTVNNFWHGEFSVMFLHNRLPLYIALFYPAFLYPVFMTIQRHRFSPIKGALMTGFFAGTAYLIFDNLGPLLGWWVWDRANPGSLPMLDSVPLTSYHWMFAFTSAFAYFAQRFFWGDGGVGGRAGLKLLAMPILTCVVGTLVFVPYNLFSFFGSPMAAAFFHAIVFGALAIWFFVSYRAPKAEPDALLMTLPLIWIISHLFFYIAKWHLFWSVGADGASQAAGYTQGLYASNVLAACAGMAVAFFIVWLSHKPSQP